MSIKLINNHNRSVLGEGRSNNMGFAFCKALNNDEYETIQPISPCKDYLNDVIFAEVTNKPISAYGLHLKGAQGIFKGEHAYIAISMCPYKYDHTYNKTQLIEDKAKLSKYHKHLEFFINYFEELLGIDTYNNTIITEVEDNLYVIELPLIWCESTYMCSLYTLLLRAGQNYNDMSLDPMKYLESNNVYKDDIGLVKSALPKLKDIIKHGPLKQDFSILKGDTSTHNLGIVGYKLDYSAFKTKEVC